MIRKRKFREMQVEQGDVELNVASDTIKHIQRTVQEQGPSIAWKVIKQKKL